MSSYLDFIETKKQELTTQEIDLNVDYFRKEFENITKLVNLFQKNKGKKGFENGAYSTIADIAFNDGVTKSDGSKLSKSLVGTYLKIVRAERLGEKKSASKVKVIAPAPESPKAPGLAMPGAKPEFIPSPTPKVVVPAVEPVKAPVVDDLDGLLHPAINGYSVITELQNWENYQVWNDNAEIIYQQFLRWIYDACIRKGINPKSDSILNLVRKHFAEPGFSNGFATTVQKLFQIRDNSTGNISTWNFNDLIK